MRYRLATEYYDDLDTGLASNPYVNDHLPDILGKIRAAQLAFRVDQENWRNRAQQQKQDFDWQEKFQKMNNKYAQLQSDVGKNNKGHSIGQGLLGLGASVGASGGFDKLFGSNAATATTTDVGVGAKIADKYDIAPSASEFTEGGFFPMPKAQPNIMGDFHFLKG